MRSLVLCATAAMSVLAAFAAPRFEKVPDQALELLKGARSKSVSSEFLLVNGHYVKPSCRISGRGPFHGLPVLCRGLSYFLQTCSKIMPPCFSSTPCSEEVVLNG